MKISLITVSYNSESTIRETFESVREQKVEGFELEYIHVDGLSNDGTMKISQEFDDIITKRISEKDLGWANAMNKGINMATGDVIGFLNSDDTFHSENVLLSIVNTFKNDQDLEVVYGDVNYVDSKNRIKRKWITGNQKEFRKGWHPAHLAYYAKKSVYDRSGGFDEELKVAADFDLMLRQVETLSSKTFYIPRVFVNMKLGGNSNKSIKNILVAKRDYYTSFKKNNIKPVFGYIYFRWAKKILQKYK